VIDITTPHGARLALAALDREAVASEGFARFVKLTWPIVEPTRKLEWTWHLDQFCLHAECCSPPWRDPPEPGETQGAWAKPLIKDLVVNVPPGTTKSMIWSVLWPAWVWTFRPEARFITVAFTPVLATGLAEKHYDLVTSPWYSDRWRAMPPGRQGVTEFHTAARGWRYTTSIGGAITGQHADFLIIDDPVKPSDADASAAETSAAVKKAVEWLGSSAASRAFDKANFVNVLVMQRITEFDPSEEMLKRPGVVHLNIPALYEPTRAYSTPYGKDPRTREGEQLGTTTNTTKENFDALAARMGGWTSPTAEAQLQQRPSPKGGLMFKDENFGKFDILAHPLIKSFNVISVDANFKKSDESSDIGIVRVGSNLPKLRVYATYSERGGFTRTLELIEEELRAGGRTNAILIEDKANGSALIEILRKKFSNVVALIPLESKEARAQAANVYYEAHSVEHCLQMRGGMGLAQFERFLSVFPRGLKKDVVDALAQALLYLTSKDIEAWKRAVNAWDSHDRRALGGLGFDDLYSIG
jgi:phage terminase large subunit-like protein